MTEGKLTAGEVDIELAGAARVLRPTIHACLELSRRWKGFRNLEIALVGLNVDAFIDVVQLGLGIEDRDQAAALVCASPLVVDQPAAANSLPSAVARFVEVLLNGGRPLEAEHPPDPPAAGG